MFRFARQRTSALVEAMLVYTLIALIAGLAGWAAWTSVASQGNRQTLEGMLSIRHGDDFAHGRETSHAYFLVRDGVETELAFNDRPPDDSVAGRRIQVEGSRQGTRFLVAAGGTQQVGGSPSSHTAVTGTKHVAVVLLNFSNDSTEPYSTSFAAGVAFTNADSVAAYYAETSWGQLTLSGDVFGWYTIPATNETCAISSWSNEATAAAAAEGIDLRAYDNVVYAFPYVPSCPWGGLATLPGRSSWLNGSAGMTLHTMAHELGHNFGTHHASALTCTDSGMRVALGAACTTSEYGDPFTVMGSGKHYEHSNFSRGNFGWLTNANTITPTAAGDYTLKPIEIDDPSGVQVVRIPRGDTGTYLTLEFRQPFGTTFDTFSAMDPVINGVTVRLTGGYAAPSRTQLVDATPTTSSFADAPLQVGQTLVDPLSGVTITTLGISASGASVHISFGVVTPTPTPAPAITPAPTWSQEPTPAPTPVTTATPAPTPIPDTEPPTAPDALNADVGKGKKVTLSWTASADNVAVAGYWLFRDGVQVTSTTDTTYTDVPPGRSTGHTYYAVAYDHAGNSSPPSNAISIIP